MCLDYSQNVGKERRTTYFSWENKDHNLALINSVSYDKIIQSGSVPIEISSSNLVYKPQSIAFYFV